MGSEPMTYVVEADEQRVGTATTRSLALLLMGKWACRGADVNLRSGRTGRLLSWGDLPCVCGQHSERSTVVQLA